MPDFVNQYFIVKKLEEAIKQNITTYNSILEIIYNKYLLTINFDLNIVEYLKILQTVIQNDEAVLSSILDNFSATNYLPIIRNNTEIMARLHRNVRLFEEYQYKKHFANFSMTKEISISDEITKIIENKDLIKMMPYVASYKDTWGQLSKFSHPIVSIASNQVNPILNKDHNDILNLTLETTYKRKQDDSYDRNIVLLIKTNFNLSAYFLVLLFKKNINCDIKSNLLNIISSNTSAVY